MFMGERYPIYNFILLLENSNLMVSINFFIIRILIIKYILYIILIKTKRKLIEIIKLLIKNINYIFYIRCFTHRFT